MEKCVCVAPFSPFYNTAGQLATIVDAQSKTTTYAYNLLGQRTSTTLPDNSSKTMAYDAAGRVLEVTLALIVPLKTCQQVPGFTPQGSS